MVYIKIHNMKENKVNVEDVSYGQCSETSGWNFFGNFVNL